MTVTSIHITVNWELISYVLQTRALPESHTGEHVADVFREAVTEWQLPTGHGVHALVTDNASNMLTAAKLFDTKIHIPCYAHTLNLACQKCLKTKRTSHILARMRHIVANFHRSNIAAASLRAKADLLGLPQHKLVIDVCTRWNSSYDMVTRFLEMQVAVFAVLRSKELKEKTKDFRSFSDEDLCVAEEVVTLLKPLKDITVALCSEKTPTVSFIMPLQHQLIDRVLQPSNGGSPPIVEMKASLRHDLENRYANQKTTLYMCSSLDPRFKLLPYLPEKERLDVYRMVANEAAKVCDVAVRVKQEPTDEAATPHLPALPNLPEEPLESLDLEKEEEPPSKKIKAEPEPQKHELGDIFEDVYICGEEPLKTPLVRAENESKLYRDMATECPLQWWKQKEEQIPLIARLARHMLCIPAPSVPSERVFSTAGDILTAQRANLKSKHVDKLIKRTRNVILNF